MSTLDQPNRRRPRQRSRRDAIGRVVLLVVAAEITDLLRIEIKACRDEGLWDISLS